MNRTRGYIRYSDHKQDDGFSVEYQTTEIKDYCYKHNLELQKLHIDQAQTGTKVAGREEFFSVMEAVKNDEVDTLIVYKLSRLFRNSLESQKYRKLLRKHNVRLVSATEAIDEYSSSGRLTTSILADIDQYQSEIISDHVKSSMREMARQGYYTGGPVQFGYKLKEIKNGSKVRKKLTPCEKEAEIVRQVFQLYATNHTLHYIQDFMRDSGFLTRNGKIFTASQISRMLRTETYIGTYKFKTQGYDEIVVYDCIEPIIDLYTWNLVAEKRKQQKKVTPRRPKGKKRRYHSLTGFIKCKDCGEHYIGYASGVSSTRKNDKARYYYACRGKLSFRKCRAKNIRKEYIESVVLDAITDRVLNENSIKVLAAEVAKMCDDSPVTIDDKIREVKKQITRVTGRIDDLIEMRLNKEVEIATATKKIAVEQEKLESLNSDLFRLNDSKKTAVTKESIESYLFELLYKLPTKDQDILRLIFEAFVDHIVVDKTEVKIHLKVYPSISAFNETNSPPFVPLYAETKR